MNARGQITSGQYGTNLSAGNGYDSFGFRTSITAGANNSKQNFTYGFNATTGNLTWRQNNNGTDLKETFNYDNLDRLDNVNKGISSPAMTLDMAYDPEKGGITTKTDVGTLMYTLSAKPYAVSHIIPDTSIVPEALDSLTYTSFESVSSIEEGAYLASFVYNPEDQRAKMEVKQNGSVILTRWYLGSNYIKETSSGVTKEYTFIGGNAYTAPAVSIRQSGVSTTYYLLRDHLGSITHVVNASTGSTTYEYSYDAWGRMRNTANWTNYSPSSEPALFVAGRGFTGHEHMPWFNLINMNGRLYDPLTGQFLNVDNNVQSPDFTQNFNRYAYCLNNPLKYTDPSGEFIWIIPNIGWSKEGGLSIGVTVSFGIPGLLSYQVGGGYSFGSKEVYGYAGATFAFNTVYTSYSSSSGWSAGYTAGASIYSGFPISTNFATVGVNYNINHDSWSGNVSAWNIDQNGCSFNPSVSAMIFPEQTTNFIRGKGFHTNSTVYDNLMTEGVAKNEILDYFGINAQLSEKYNSPSWFDPKTSTIYMNPSTVSEGNYWNVLAYYEKELYHYKNYKHHGQFSKQTVEELTSAGFDISNLDRMSLNNAIMAPEEIDGFRFAIRNQGLYSKSTAINSFIGQINHIFGPYMPSGYTYSSKWWHKIYRIPRKW